MVEVKYRPRIDGQVMKTTSGGLAMDVGKFEGKRATVTYAPNEHGALILKAIAAPVAAKLEELPADAIPF